MSIIFNGTTQRLALSNNNSAFQDVFGATIFIRFRITNMPGTNLEDRMVQFTTNGGGAGASRLSLNVTNISGTNAIRCFSRRLDGDSGETVDGATSLSTGVVHSAALVAHWTNQLFQNYLDGVVDASSTPSTWTGNSSNTTSDLASIGARADTTQLFDGELEDVIMFPFPLNAVQIGKLHVLGITTNLQGSSVITDEPSWHKCKGLGSVGGTQPDVWQRNSASTVGSPSYASRIFKARSAIAGAQ